MFEDERRFVFREVVAGRMVELDALLRNKKAARGCRSRLPIMVPGASLIFGKRLPK